MKSYRTRLRLANREIKTLIDQVSKELTQSLQIQKYLVPTEFPNIKGFQFSTKFQSSSLSGGDYFDIFEHKDKMRFGLFMSSSSGYGMSSLFLSVLMKRTSEIEEERNRNPSSIMKEILGELKENIGPKDQTSIFYGAFDRRKFQLSYCNVGQPLIFHYNSSKSTTKTLPLHAPPLSSQSLLKEIPLRQKLLDLNPKDKLIFCSSGFLSLKKSDKTPIKQEDILFLVEKNIQKDVHSLRNEVFYQVLKNNPSPPKDLTLIVAQVKSRIIKLVTVEKKSDSKGET